MATVRGASTRLAILALTSLVSAAACLADGAPGNVGAQRPAAAGAPAVGAPRLRMLFLHRTMSIDSRYREELRAEGISVTERGLTEPVSLTEFRSYNLVVIPDFLTLDAAFQVGATDVPTWWDVTLPNLRAYVEQGGGLLIGTFFCEGGEALATAMNRMLAPWGAELRALQVIDPGHIASIAPEATQCSEKPGKVVQDKTFYCWTERTTPHPATVGIRRIYYPVCNMRWDDCYTTPPIVLSDRAWTPLVRGMAQSRLYNTKTDKSYQWQDPMGTDDVLAAVRAVGKGRVALQSINSYHVFFRPYTTEASLGENHHGAIDGIPLHKGDGKTPSDLGRLLTNLYRWLAEPGQRLGLGRGPARPQAIARATKASVTRVIDWDAVPVPPTWRHRPIPAQVEGQTYYDEQPDVTIRGELHYYKALIGIHSAFSDGRGTVQQYAQAAHQAGYSLIAFTEGFEALGGPAHWEALRRECERCTTSAFVCLPGIDIADPEGGRFLVFGQPNYPAKPWLSPDGKFLVANNAMSLGFTTHLAAIARPHASPHQYRLFKHFQGIAVATYRGERLADDGREAYAWQVSSGSNPIPLAVHEVLAPGEVAVAAHTGFQQIMPADTVAHASDYFRCALSHFFDCPQRYFISEGPVIDTWTIINKDAGKPEEYRDRYRIAMGAASDAPLREVALYAEGVPMRRWLPRTASFREHVDGVQAWQHHWYMMVTDSLGRRALSPPLRNVPGRYIVRCGDRQNWLGYVSMYYTGTPLRDIDISMPVEETQEGDGTFRYKAEKGTFLAPMLEFPLTSVRASEDDYLLTQRYANVEAFDEVCYDATPMRTTIPSKLYDGRVRVLNFAPRANTPDCLDGYLYDVSLKLKMDAHRKGDDGVWPWFAAVSGRYYVQTQQGWQAGDIGDDTRLDLHPGDIVGECVALSPGLRLAGKRFGLAAPTDRAVRAGETFDARFFQCNRMLGANQYNPLKPCDVGAHMPELAAAMGFAGPTPYGPVLGQGRIESVQYAARLTASDGGVAGTIRGVWIPYNLPLMISGVSPRWTAGVWRADAPGRTTDQCAVSADCAYTTIDVSKDVSFYAGNFVLADNPAVVLNIEAWSRDAIAVEVHNPTDAAMTITVRTPAAIAGLKPLRTTVTVPAGTTVRVKG